jgi:aspartate aminotransferase
VDRLRAADVAVPAPEGGFYLFPDFAAHAPALRRRGIRTSAELCEALLEETGVGILPGSDFGRPEEELTARIAYVDFDGARAMAAAETVPRDEPLGGDFVSVHCGRVLRAMDAVAAWLGRGGGGRAPVRRPVTGASRPSPRPARSPRSRA